MRVLIALEESGVIRDAFLKLGHDAMSCDLKPTRSPGPHYQGDIFDILNDGWDLMIGHPVCTYLTVTANKWNKEQAPRKSGALVGKERLAARAEAIEFFMKLWNAPINQICLENPVGIMSTVWREPDQIIQPMEFGHAEPKEDLPLVEKLAEVGLYARWNKARISYHKIRKKDAKMVRIRR